MYRPTYICLWEMPDGRYVGDAEGNFLVAESKTQGDPIIETKMRAAVRSFGIVEGKPLWQIGRKVSSMEFDDQMERMLEGKIPDEQEEVLIHMEDQLLQKRGYQSED